MSKELDFQGAWLAQQHEKKSPALVAGVASGKPREEKQIYPGTMPETDWVAADSLVHREL